MITAIKNNAFARNSLILFAGTVATSLLNYFFHLAIGRMVSVETYGQAESLISLISIISVPAAAIGLVATKFAAAGKADNDPANSLWLWKCLNRRVFIFGLPIFLLALILTPLVGKFLKIDNYFSLILIWLMMFISFFGTINAGILNGWQKFKRVSANSVIGVFVKLCSGLILVKLGFALNGIIGAFVISLIVAYFVSILMLRFLKAAPAKDEPAKACKIDFSPVKRYIVPVFIGSLAINFLGNIDMVFAKHNLDPVAAGQYGALYIIAKIIFFVVGVLSTVLFAMAAEHSHKKSDSGLILKSAFGLALLFCAGSVFFYFLFPRFVLSIFFGAKYLSVASYLGWFAISASLFSLANLILQYLLSIHETKIANILLAISIAAGVFILLLGKSIFAILIIIGLANLAGVFVGSLFLRRRLFPAPEPQSPPILNNYIK